MATRPDHPLKDTTVCHLQEATTSLTEETMGEMIGGMVGLPRGVDLTTESVLHKHPRVCSPRPSSHFEVTNVFPASPEGPDFDIS